MAGSDISEPVNEFTLENNERLLVLMCLRQREVISHLSWGRKGDRAGTALTKLNLERIHELSSPIKLASAIGSGYLNGVERFFEGSEVFASSGECSELLDRLCSNFAEIDAYVSESIADYVLVDELTPHKKLIVRQEHDAVEMALRIAGMIPRKSYRWSPTQQGEKSIASFFSGLKPERSGEDDVVRWDADKIPGFSLVKKELFGHYILKNGSSTLHTFHANKTPLENTLGVDLIYFNESHKNFVFVQYKMAEPQGKTHIFRFPDEQLTEEIKRMDNLLSALDSGTPDDVSSPVATGFRMLGDPFFLKFCPKDMFLPDQNEQVRGMVIPVSLWKLIENDSSGRFVGPGGGRLLSFENCPRYLDNTRFIALVQEGWFGTEEVSSTFLEQVISEIINTKRSLILAAKISSDPEPAASIVATRKRASKKKKSSRAGRKPRGRIGLSKF